MHQGRPAYEVRVRGPGAATPDQWPWPGIDFLWGSLGIPNPVSFDKPLILHIRNDVFGEDVTFGTLVNGTKTQIGTLQPGECASIQVSKISGVYATCEPGLDSVVACIITD
ncbi:hypothetical protein OKW35_000047 [Paraburkholderia sp. MM5477-R1]